MIMKTSTLFNERRSVGSFDSSKKIEDTLVKEIVNTAVLAPSAFNLQPWRIIVVKSDNAKQTLFEHANKQEKVLEAAVNLLIVGNKNGFDETNPVWAEMLTSVGGNVEIVNGAKQAAAYLYGTSEERKIKFAESNAGLLSMALMFAAKEKGVDSHPMSGLDFDGLHKDFGLKDGEDVVMNLALGYTKADQTLHPRRPRLGFDEIASIV
jgi:putative NAD(P)H nitroreductase